MARPAYHGAIGRTKKSLAAGMVDTRNVIHRTEKMSRMFTLGSEKKFVDHEMIAAGHPDLYFELDSFSAVMPRHWKSAAGIGSWQSGGRSELGWRAGDWSVGASCPTPRGDGASCVGALRAQRRSRKQKKFGPNIPSCPALLVTIHLGLHKIAGEQEHGYPGRRPGDPAWNASRYLVFSAFLAKQVDVAAAHELDKRLAAVTDEMSKLNPDRSAVIAATNSARVRRTAICRAPFNDDL